MFPKVPFETGGGFHASLMSLAKPHIFSELVSQTLLAAAIYLALLGIAYGVRRRRLNARGAR